MFKNLNLVNITEIFILSVRWFLLPMYFGLYIALLVYNFDFIVEVYHMIRSGTSVDVALVIILGLIDIIMVGQLVVQTNIGGYTLFVKEFDYAKLTNKPRFLNNLTSTTQKVKLGMSLMGVSTVHLLAEFLSPDKTSDQDLTKQIVIIIIFMAVTCWYGICDKLIHPAAEHKEEH